MMNSTMINTNGVHISAETFGDSRNPAVLLIMGATASMLYWDKEFCTQLAIKGFFVIRYDHRDTGRSTTYPAGTTNYDIVDLADDAVGVLDELQISSAHFFGMSLGGLITQIVAIQHPNRVASLTLFATGPWGPSDPDIPEMDQAIVDHQAKADSIDWTDKKAVVSYMVQGSYLINGGSNFDRPRHEALFSKEFDRANIYKSMLNHAQLQGGEAYYGQLDKISQPALILHGDRDLIWNYRHAQFLVSTLKNAKLVTLKDTGHELHPKDRDMMISAFSTHAKSSGI